MPDSRWKLVSIRTLCGEGDGRRGKAERHQFQHFYPRPPQGGRPTIRRWTMPSGQFLSTPSARRATSGRERLRNPRQISIHALREEGDPLPRLRLCVHQKFLSTPSARRATKRWRPTPTSTTHFYPRPPRGGRLDDVSVEDAAQIFLSTPSARRATLSAGTRADVEPFLSTPSARRATFFQGITVHSSRYFYPRPPRGGRPLASRSFCTSALFLSTPSARRATRPDAVVRAQAPDFYPRPPRGGRRVIVHVYVGQKVISIHALREEGDVRPLVGACSGSYFYPRPPRGGRHLMPDFRFCSKVISIHALREEGDVRPLVGACSGSYFYPRPPRGGRRLLSINSRPFEIFLSTPSARRATVILHVPSEAFPISIHALREEGDSTWIRRNNMAHNFYPRPPRGGRLLDARAQDPEARISIHALREEGDGSPTRPTTTSSNFYPRPPRGGRPGKSLRWTAWRIFLSTPSARRATLSARERAIVEYLFLSTPSARRATGWDTHPGGRGSISIHALREEGDL